MFWIRFSDLVESSHKESPKSMGKMAKWPVTLPSKAWGQKNSARPHKYCPSPWENCGCDGVSPRSGHLHFRVLPYPLPFSYLRTPYTLWEAKSFSNYKSPFHCIGWINIDANPEVQRRLGTKWQGELDATRNSSVRISHRPVLWNVRVSIASRRDRQPNCIKRLFVVTGWRGWFQVTVCFSGVL